MKKFLIFFICFLFTWNANAQQSGPFSIEEVLSSSFPSGLISSSKEGRLVWVENAKGVRNIWLAEPPNYVGSQITTYTRDDGQDLTNLQFLKDEGAIIYLRGSNTNRKSEFPNPSIIAKGVSQEIHLFNLASKMDTIIAKGRSPKINPVKDEIVFIRKGQVWYKNLNDQKEPNQLMTTRGNASNLIWSPDGTKLAFVSNRSDHSFIGVYNLAEANLRYLSPSVDKDSNPVWSPDGSKAAFIRTPNERNQLIFEPHRSGLPWSIMVVNVNTGEPNELWKADEGMGSVFRQISAANQIFWTQNNYIVFPWEKYGWTNLFSVDTKSKKVNRLTNGNFEVQFVSMSWDGKEVLYSSNQNNIDRQHIWKSPADGSTAVQITSGEGIEWAPVSLPNGDIIAFASGPTTPAYAARWKNGKASPLRDNSDISFPTRHLVKPEQIIFDAADGMKIHGQLFKPKDYNSSKKYPGVLFFHGGSRRQMLLGFHHRGYYHNAYALNQYLASQGYIVLSVNYRSGIGYGTEFRETLNYGATGASEFNDVLGAGLYLKNRSDVDPDRIGLWGGSYGGYLTALGLARASDLFAAGVDLHGVHDWNVVIKNFRPGYNPNSNPDFAKLAFDSSPLSSIETWRSPVLLIHGDDDRNVPFSETVDIAESLRKQGVTFEQLIFPDEVHGFLLHQNWVNAYLATADFFNRKLKNK